jgi:hypothetical protein
VAKLTSSGGDPTEPVRPRRSPQEALEFAEEFADLLASFLRVAQTLGEEHVTVSWRDDLLAGLEQFTETDNPVIDVLHLSADVLYGLKTKLAAFDPNSTTFRSLAADVAQAEPKVKRAAQRFKENRRNRLRVDRPMVTVRVPEETVPDPVDHVDQVATPDTV